MPMLAHTSTCCVSRTNCCLGDVSSVAFMLLARGFCLFYSRVEVSILLETPAHICAVNWSVWVGHSRSLRQHDPSRTTPSYCAFCRSVECPSVFPFGLNAFYAFMQKKTITYAAREVSKFCVWLTSRQEATRSMFQTK